MRLGAPPPTRRLCRLFRRGRATARRCAGLPPPDVAEVAHGDDEPPAETSALPKSFCIIESRDTDFAALQLDEIQANIDVRKNSIFLLMEEIRRLRIQLRLKAGSTAEEDVSEEEFESALPLLPPLTERSIKDYYVAFTVIVLSLIAFGGYVAPMAEVKLGLGGTSYAEFVASLGLPKQLSEVDPIVASFTGGAVGVISMLLVVEVNNVKGHAEARCVYCSGTGYLPCAQCGARGKLVATEGRRTFCTPCSGSGKVMCTSCLCTGRRLATEHDPRRAGK